VVSNEKERREQTTKRKELHLPEEAAKAAI